MSRYPFGMWDDSLVTAGKSGSFRKKRVERMQKKMKPSRRICFNGGYRDTRTINVLPNKIEILIFIEICLLSLLFNRFFLRIIRVIIYNYI